MTQERVCRCERCDRRITEEEYEMHDGMSFIVAVRITNFMMVFKMKDYS